MEKVIIKKHLSIAVVDDHKVFRKTLTRSLRRILPGCKVAEAENGKKFLELLDAHEYDLVLMDVMMPVMNGIEATKRAKLVHPGIKVLALSMHDDPDFIREMKNAGAMGYIIKGGNLKKMKCAIQHILSGDQYYSLN